MEYKQNKVQLKVVSDATARASGASLVGQVSSAAVITLDTLTLPSFSRKKDYLVDCPWNVPHYTAMVRGSRGMVSSSGYPQHFSYSWQPNTSNS